MLHYFLNVFDLYILLFSSDDFSVIAYSDSDWTTCVNYCKSITRFYITLGGNPIFCKSKKHPTISLSLVEAEYRALCKVVAEFSYFKCLLGDPVLSITLSISIYCDSQAVIHIAKNLILHKRTKHIDVDCHFMRDCLSDDLISLHFLHSAEQLADLFTKSFFGILHHQLLSKLAVYPFFSLRGGVDVDIGPHDTGSTSTDLV